MRILSYGCGINSTAILALAKLGKYPMPDKIIFCDTGAERPATYCYLKYISKHFNIEVIRNEKETLIEYCKRNKIFPVRQLRWCTDKFKIIPIKKHLEGLEHIKILGISADESYRVKDYNAEYPLCDKLITRNMCIELIQRSGLEVPVKSGCFICPNMRKLEMIELKTYHPEQYKILCDLEKQSNKRNPTMFFKDNGKFIDDYIYSDDNELLDGFENYQHCLCKYD